jgi:hypothetical protein
MTTAVDLVCAGIGQATEERICHGGPVASSHSLGWTRGRDQLETVKEDLPALMLPSIADTLAHRRRYHLRF